MINIKKHMSLLGLPVKDLVTGFEGVVSSMSFDLYGCIQAIVTPAVKKGEKSIENSHWFDVSRLEVLKKVPVMPVPDFDFGPIAESRKGPAQKSIPSRY